MLQSVISGILQGIFEWLPISSQGNLSLITNKLFGYSPPEAFSLSIFLHSGTLLAAIIYFRKEIKTLFLAFLKERFQIFKPGQSQEYKTISFLLVSSALTGTVGYPLLKLLNVPDMGQKIFLLIIAFGLISSGLFQKFIKPKGLKTKKGLGLGDAVILGIAQGFAIIPGISRSGITVSALLLRNYQLKDSLKLSFLMSIPAVLGAQLGLILTDSMPSIPVQEAIAAISASFLTGILTIHILLRLVEKIRFWAFCIIVGLITLIPLFF